MGLSQREKELLRELNSVVYQQMHNLLEAFNKMDVDGDKRVRKNDSPRMQLISLGLLGVSRGICSPVARV